MNEDEKYLLNRLKITLFISIPLGIIGLSLVWVLYTYIAKIIHVPLQFFTFAFISTIILYILIVGTGGYIRYRSIKREQFLGVATENEKTKHKNRLVMLLGIIFLIVGIIQLYLIVSRKLTEFLVLAGFEMLFIIFWLKKYRKKGYINKT